MAIQEHVDLLMQGSNIWNAWRTHNKGVQQDLSYANLKYADLSGANLSGVNLSGADLFDTDLRYADLSYADLSYANLRYANLYTANLVEANFYRADLTGANLKEANLYTANLRRAQLWCIKLSGANLTEANLTEADLRRANLSGVNLKEANLRYANFIEADLSGVDLSGQDLSKKNFSGANLSEANLSGANLSEADFTDTDLSKANLKEANLSRAIIIGTNMTEAILTDCSIFGISAWNVRLKGATQLNLVITPNRADEPIITVDNLEVAQFIYLLLDNEKIRKVIDTITYKVVLILGRFTPERKVVLDAIREELRKQDYLPVLFDFEKPANRDFTETVRTLAHLARFIIADLTEPSSISLELQAIVPDLAVPVQPLFKVSQVSKHEFSMFQDLSKKYHWVLPIYHYTGQASLLQSLKEKVIDPSEIKAQELENR